MTSVDWSTDHNIPATVSAPDLFGGELFGDELMDMYNSDAVVGTHDLLSDHHSGRSLAHHDSFDDDGLGAFRPSTSFNDLTSLLSGDESPDAPLSSAVLPPVSLVGTSGQKRSAESSKVSEPAQKKRSPTVKARPNPPSRRAAMKTPKPATTLSIPNSDLLCTNKLKKEQLAPVQGQGGRPVNNTPNPLSGFPATQKSTIKSVPVPSITPVPSVVTPRIVSIVKAESITSEAAAATAAAVAVAAAAAISMPTSAAAAGPATEADFKSVAQAAVSNLILNAGAPKGEIIKVSKPDNEKVDTSTAHIKALTSTNWVAACSGGDSVSGEGSETGGAVVGDNKANRARRQNLTPDERARQNRDRNREHARNTRLRKKAYVEELKRTLTELVSQRDAAELEKRHSAQRELEQREVRFRVMEELLKLRGRNEASFSRWAAILEESFSLKLPITDFRKMVEDADGKSEQVLKGTREAMADASHLASFLQTLGSGMEDLTHKSPVTLAYQCDRKNFFMDGCNGVLSWTASTVGAVGEGAPMELTLRGNMRAKFSPASNKLITAEIMFDTGTIASQLQLLDSNHVDFHDDEEENGHSVACEEEAAAQAAANEADALLDSLQMPHLDDVPSAITVSDGGTAVSVSDKDDSSDEGLGETTTKKSFSLSDTPTEVGILTRRSSRRKD